MINMRPIYLDASFQKALQKFHKKLPQECYETTDCEWSLFKKAFLKFSKYKCPICEDRVRRYDDIDHFRPKEEALYPFLKCCYQNYIVMCSECNRFYKKSNFPLLNPTQKATSVVELKNEKPLLVNPMHDDIFELFQLEFIVSNKNNKKMLVVAPKDGIDDESRQKAQATIELYGIGNCDDNDKIDDCRIDLLENHYDQFIELAKRAKKYFEDKTERNRVLLGKKIKEKPSLEKYGFVEFIKKGQFKIAI
ncbi:MAG: hypothetical protein KU38_10925 [Sulfurovum sp. FS08-3]|nr:MAG: hypothetical protein KU38_10925 [Sulfurovum sp. FS08-3]